MQNGKLEKTLEKSKVYLFWSNILANVSFRAKCPQKSQNGATKALLQKTIQNPSMQVFINAVSLQENLAQRLKLYSTGMQHDTLKNSIIRSFYYENVMKCCFSKTTFISSTTTPALMRLYAPLLANVFTVRFARKYR